MWARHHGSLQAYAGPSGVLPGVLPQPESRRAVDRGSRINSQPTYRGHLGAQRPLHPSVHSCGCHSAGLEVQSAARNSAGRFMVRTPDVAPQFQTGGENGLSHSFRWRELRGWGRRCSPALDPIRAAGLIQCGRAGEHRLPHLRSSGHRKECLSPFSFCRETPTRNGKTAPWRSRLGNKSRGIIAVFSEPRAQASGPCHLKAVA